MVIFRISHVGVNIANVEMRPSTAINLQKDGGKDPRGRINNNELNHVETCINIRKKLLKIPSIMMKLRY